MSHNPRLADKQGLDTTTREIIDKLHLLRDYIEIEAGFNNRTDQDQKDLYNVWFENEKLLQKLWKFPDNEDYIKFWTFSGCSCPKMDNDDNYPYGRYIKVQDCILHGW